MTQPAPPTLPSPAAGTGWLSRVLKKALGRWGCRLGLAWILVVSLLAVFAPVLASSHPFLLKMDGQWSSPWLRHLSKVDVILMAGAFITLGLLALRRASLPSRWIIGAGLLGLAALLALVFVRPPLTTSLSQYRLAEQAGKVQYILRVPIPFSPTDRLRDQFDADHPHPQPPSARHWLGTERNGADVLSRMIHACRIAMAVGFIATGIAVVIGIFVGGLMGYFVGWVDLIGMRLVEIFSAIPTIFLILTIVAFYGRDLYIIMAVIGLTGWVGDARFIRAEFLRLRNQEYILAARAAALPLHAILFRHMLPNGVAPVLVSAGFGIAGAILTESTLSFLGLGLVDEPSWGELLNQALAASGNFNWWLATFPGLAIFLTVFSYNLIGEAARDAIDPKAHA